MPGLDQLCPMLDVFFTVDVEIWCDGWHDLDRKFPAAFDCQIRGKTPRGDFGLAFQAKALSDHGLPGVFFVEPLFANRFGLDPLQEIVGLIPQSDHEIQLHPHTEWVDEAISPMLPDVGRKRQFLHEFSDVDQSSLIAVGREMLHDAGARPIQAFRAGSFGACPRTLQALARAGIPFDSSYNAAAGGQSLSIAPGQVLNDVTQLEGVREYPVSVFSDGVGRLRHAQLGACSIRELESLLWQGLEHRHQAVVLFSHNFELLRPSRHREDPVVVKRFLALLAFLDRNRDCFRVRGFRDLALQGETSERRVFESSGWRTGARMFEQVLRRRYDWLAIAATLPDLLLV